jgi:hypothetical protein
MSRGSVVKAKYDRIFNADPLLLLEDNQRDYGKAILQHLLIYRPQTTSQAYLLDLHSSTSRANFGRQASTAAAPPAGIARSYNVARRDRQDPGKADFDTLKDITMVSRGSFTHDRTQGHYPSHSSQAAFLKTKPDRVRIAAVGYRLKVSKLDEQSYLSEDLATMTQQRDSQVPNAKEARLLAADNQLGRTVSDDHGLTAWETAIIELVKRTIQRESEIILLPEFTLPPARSASSFESRLQAVCASARHDFFLFSGSRHEERYNRGWIFSRNGSVAQDKLQSHWHYKIASARGLGENILGPHSTSLPSYRTNIRIANNCASVVVAVCYDTYDPTVFLNLVLDGVRADEDYIPKIILVPAYNPGSDFVELLRDLSFLAQCTVVYVNGLHGDAQAFVCGVRLLDIVEHLPLLLTSLTDKATVIGQELQDEDSEFQRRKVADPRHVRSNEEVDWIEEKRRLQGSLQTLHNALLLLQANSDLTALITIEDCWDCDNGHHQLGDRLCFRDILYYNIDRKLLSALSDFRAEFFSNDDFLPEPFRRKNLGEAARDI